MRRVWNGFLASNQLADMALDPRVVDRLAIGSAADHLGDMFGYRCDGGGKLLVFICTRPVSAQDQIHTGRGPRELVLGRFITWSSDQIIGTR